MLLKVFFVEKDKTTWKLICDSRIHINSLLNVPSVEN